MEAGDYDSALTNLIVNYLPQDFRNGELYTMFITMGPIVSHRVMIDRETGYSYGYGFVNFEKPEDAAKAIEKLNGLQIENKKIKVAYALPCKRDELVENNLYIRRLPRDITEDKLQELFGQFGTITQKKLLKDTITGLNRGVGFVRFSKRSEAQAAIEALHDKLPPGGTERLSVRVASDQKKQNMAFYAGFFESQKYIRGEFGSKQNSPTTSLKAAPSSPNKGPRQNGRQVTPSIRTLLPTGTSSGQNQNVAFRHRGPLVTPHQHPMFRSPNYMNGNFGWTGGHTGFIQNIHRAPPPSAAVTLSLNNRPLAPWKQRNSIPVRFNAVTY